MKTIFFSLLLGVLCVNSFSQSVMELDSQQVTILNLKLDTLDYYRELVKQDSIELKQADSIISIKQAKITNLQEQISSYKQLRILEGNTKPEEPFFIWDGFFTGIGTGMMFDSVITKSSLTRQLFDKLYLWAKPRILMAVRFVFEGILKIPFKDKPFLGVEIGYRLF